MTDTVELRRAATIPDPTRIARYQRSPELGPKLLFFSGGTALAKCCRELKRYTHNSIHLVTAFDSGGSSAVLRNAFGILSVGDLRQRMMSLADETARGNPEIYRLFSHRLPVSEDHDALAADLAAMVAGEHPLVRDIPSELRQIVRTHLRAFREAMPPGFDLRRASIGNLVLTGGLLSNDRDVEAVIFLFSRLVEVRGLVSPIVDADVQLAATLASGERIVGQHRMTGKQESPIGAPIRDLSLVASFDDPSPVRVACSEVQRDRIESADLICYPTGSFYTSVLANLLVDGVGRSIAAARCPKVYVPNMGRDPEQLGMTLSSSVARLLEAVRRDTAEDTPAERILDLVLVDTARGDYAIELDTAAVEALGVRVVDTSLVRDAGWRLIDANKLALALLSMT